MQQKSDGNNEVSMKLDIRKTKKVPLVNVLKNLKEVNDERLFRYIEGKFNLKDCDKNKVIQIPEGVEETLQETVLKVNNIVTNVCNFVNAFVVCEYESSIVPSKINLPFLLAVIKCVTKRSGKSGRKGHLDKHSKNINNFYEKHFKKTITDDNIVYDDKLSQILQYEMKEIIKNIEVNIKEHYIQYLYRCINIYFNLEQKQKDLKQITNIDKRKEESKKMYAELNLLKKDVLQPISNLCRVKFESNKKHHKWLLQAREKLVPLKKFKQNNVFYDIQCDPQDYLVHMITINKMIHYLKNDKAKRKLFHIIPLRNSFIPAHITIDTSCLISILNDKGGNANLFKNINNCKNEIWNTYFKINTNNFRKKGYKFTYMIKTDGVSCSILFAREDRINSKGEVIDYTKNELNNVCKIRDKIENEYIESVENINKVLKNKSLICNDPNAGDLIHAGKIVVDQNGNKKLVKFKYTRNQRRLETKVKKYRDIRNKVLEEKIKIDIKSEIGLKLKEMFQYTIHEISVTDLQNTLSWFTSKLSILTEILKFVKHKNMIDVLIRDVYRRKIFRKLRFNTYTNVQKSESKMVNNFKKKMGDPKNTVIAYGDYDDNGNHIKGKEPIVSKRLRRVLRKGGYKCYLINECNTSALCNICESKTESFMERISKKPKNKGKKKMEEVWGLRRCSNLNCKVKTQNGIMCQRIYNRDDNAVMNMIKIVEYLKKYGKKPPKYCREKNE